MATLTMERYNVVLDDINNRMKDKTPEEISKLDEGMALTLEDHFQFQQLQAQMHAIGVLSTEVSTKIHQALGMSMSQSNGGWKSHVTTADKVVITKLMHELLTIKLKTVGNA